MVQTPSICHRVMPEPVDGWRPYFRRATRFFSFLILSSSSVRLHEPCGGSIAAALEPLRHYAVLILSFHTGVPDDYDDNGDDDDDGDDDDSDDVDGDDNADDDNDDADDVRFCQLR